MLKEPPACALMGCSTGAGTGSHSVLYGCTTVYTRSCIADCFHCAIGFSTRHVHVAVAPACASAQHVATKLWLSSALTNAVTVICVLLLITDHRVSVWSRVTEEEFRGEITSGTIYSFCIRFVMCLTLQGCVLQASLQYTPAAA